MTHSSCPHCRLRLTSGAAAGRLACPACGRPLETLSRPGDVVGYQLIGLEDAPRSLPEAIAVALPAPGHYLGQL